MELPPALRSAVEGALAGVSTDELAASASALSARYRAELRDGRFHVDAESGARAYLAARLPATYAATRAAMDAVDERLPYFKPASQLDIGAGPGTAVFAAADCWPSLARATLIEGSEAMRRQGERLANGAPLTRNWQAVDFAAGLPSLAQHDLVTIAYVLDELEPSLRTKLVAAAWTATTGLLLVVEPGTPAGWQRILEARTALVAVGATIVAPCPHEAPCPLMPPDWCHFAARVARSRVHLRTKNASVPFEDEKFIYLAASRIPAETRPARILAPPRAGSGRVQLKLCRPDGTRADRLVTRREGDAFREARRANWGDVFTGGDAGGG